MFEIIETKTYIRKVRKFLKKHPNIFKKYEKTIFILEQNPHHPSLRLHKLQGEMKEYFSVSIDMEYRIIIDFIIVDEKIYLLDIGSHDEIY
jgi:mRNA-degrading endonuclease YafQ of YafQ-DinJ toxin-antitoxin module